MVEYTDPEILLRELQSNPQLPDPIPNHQTAARIDNGIIKTTATHTHEHGKTVNQTGPEVTSTLHQTLTSSTQYQFNTAAKNTMPTTTDPILAPPIRTKLTV